MRVLVTGGAGYIGSHAVRELLEEGHTVTVLDNLSRGHAAAVDKRARFELASTADSETLREVLARDRIEAVLHFAADIEVAESVAQPGKYYRNNFANTINLLDALVETGVKRFVFSSTAAVYGTPEKTPIEETAALAPINPYGRGKMMVELALEDYRKAHGLGYACLRYFNVAGASADASLGEDHEPETHLVPRLLMAARDGGEASIFGTDYPTADGTCVRDYVHVVDLAHAHALALKALTAGEARVYNLGSEDGFSVRDVIRAVERVTSRPLRTREEGRRVGDPPTLVASSRKIRAELGWERRYPDIETIVRHAWAWHLRCPNGYSQLIS